MADQNKISKTLSAEELARFCDRLSKMRKVTLQTIADAFEEETGEKVSLMGATSFRDTTYARHIAAIQKAAALNSQLKALKQEGVGAGESLELLISERLMDQLVEFDATVAVAGGDSVGALNTLSKITKRLSDSERGNKALNARIAELERRDAEREEKKKRLEATVTAAKSKGGLTKETLATIEQQLAIL